MRKVFVDTNIILDWLANRAPFAESAQQLFYRAEIKKVELMTSTMAFISAEYILRKQVGKEKTLVLLAGIRKLLNVCSAGPHIIDLCLVSPFRNFEDAFQYYNAVACGAEVIISRNQKDFAPGDLLIISAEAFLRTL